MNVEEIEQGIFHWLSVYLWLLFEVLFVLILLLMIKAFQISLPIQELLEALMNYHGRKLKT